MLQTPDLEPDTAHRRPQSSARRVQAWRDRQKRRAVQVTIELEPSTIAALEHLSLLNRGERDTEMLAQAVMRYLAGAAALGQMGDALWP